jgi:hypothetical protein
MRPHHVDSFDIGPGGVIAASGYHVNSARNAGRALYFRYTDQPSHLSRPPGRFNALDGQPMSSKSQTQEKNPRTHEKKV